MIDALETYLDHLARTGDHGASVVRAAEKVADRPWDVVHVGGALARCRVAVADRDLGLTRRLAVTAPSGAAVVVKVEKGQPYPVPDHEARRGRGAFDPPVDMARRVVRAAVAAVYGPVQTALDPACGTGAFLLACKECAIPEIYGTDLDEVALAVAQVAVPEARLLVEDPFKHGPPVDVVVGGPPFLPPDRQGTRLRWELRRRFPWLRGRFDLTAPAAAEAVSRAREGGAVGLVLPAALMVAPYAAPVRRRWLERHRVVELSGPHALPASSAEVMFAVLGVGQGGAPLPVYGIEPSELLRLENVPWNPDLMPGDVELVERVRALSVALGEVADVESGVVPHGPDGGKNVLIHDAPAAGRVPYAEAREFFTGERAWLDYAPERLHRARRRELFERPKIVVQRQRGAGSVRAAIDWDGVFVGQSCTVVLPREDRVPLERLLELFRSPLLDGLTRIEHGRRLDLYPGDVAAFPVPRAWLDNPSAPLESCWKLNKTEASRLRAFAR